MKTNNDSKTKPKKRIWLRVILIIIGIYAVLFGVSVLLSTVDWTRLGNTSKRVEQTETQEPVTIAAEDIEHTNRVLDPFTEGNNNTNNSNQNTQETVAQETETQRDENQESQPGNEENDSATESTVPAIIPEVRYGDEDVEFVTDDYHYVYENPKDTYYVVTHNGEKIYGYAKYDKFKDKDAALEYLDVLNMAGTIFYPEIMDIYARNEYVVTEYNETYWIGKQLNHIDFMFHENKIEPEEEDEKTESTETEQKITED